MTTSGFRPTHVVPQHGMPAWEAPDPSRPTVDLDPLLPVQLLERQGDWGHVLCFNGWSAWVDGRRLVAVPQDPPAADGPLTRTADPRPLLGRAHEALTRYRSAVEDLAGGLDRESFRARTHGMRIGVVVDGESVWLYDSAHGHWVYADGTRMTTYATDETPGARPEPRPAAAPAHPPTRLVPPEGPDETPRATRPVPTEGPDRTPRATAAGALRAGGGATAGPTPVAPPETPRPTEAAPPEAPPPTRVVTPDAPEPYRPVPPEAPEPTRVVAPDVPGPTRVVASEASEPTEAVPSEGPPPTRVVAPDAPEPARGVPPEAPEATRVVASDAAESVGEPTRGAGADVPGPTRVVSRQGDEDDEVAGRAAEAPPTRVVSPEGDGR
ncbi:hypothetical protein [Streptomyces sp. NPDC093598]|uniref:hypothetical protein n=1 Tax=Streptomyces sp. NPDC093598 TaxID=3366046 RepID=UPI0038172549